MLTHFWDADGNGLHIVSLQTNGDFKPNETIQIHRNSYLVERVDHKVTTAGNESLHIFVRSLA